MRREALRLYDKEILQAHTAFGGRLVELHQDAFVEACSA
jgi:hypothetical protein